jgi:sensor histidine kinase regulating citrate/malate metabolism
VGGGEACVRNVDTGRGILGDRLSKLFEVGFSEKHSRMRMHVGLSNAHTIVQRHGGRYSERLVVCDGDIRIDPW